jgi:hypothetical protein
MTKRIAPLMIVWLCLISLWACQPGGIPNINLEQKDHPVASQILSPGMGTIGIIKEGTVHIFFMNEDFEWEEDKRSAFSIPEKNDGLLATGNGTIGVLRGRRMHFFRLNDNNDWKVQKDLELRFPRRQQSVIAIKMPWEMGQVAFHWDGYLEFFYHDAVKGWTHDETATFALPPGIDRYLSLGNMTVAVSDENSLGVYHLHPEGGWIFLKDHVLQLPRGYEAIIPFEPGVIAVLIDDKLSFYALDARQGAWILDEDMGFMIP